MSGKRQQKKAKRVYTGTFKGWEYKGDKTFDDAYDKIVDRFYHTGHNETASPIYLNKRRDQKRVCAICGLFTPEVSFNKEAHAIPACIGNRIYFTLEECDDCNGNAGRDWEEHLGAMTTAERGLFGIPNRTGTVKWTYENKPNQIKRISESGLVIEVGGNADSIKVTHDEEAKKIELEGPAKPYNEVPAIKSLLHSAWFFLDERQRETHSYILEILKDETVILPFVYYTDFLPDHNSQAVRLRVFELKANDKELPSCVIQLNIGHTLLTWAAPNVNTKKYIPFPIPPLSSDPSAPPPSMTVVTSKDLIGERKQTRAKFQLVYGSLEKPKNKKSTKTSKANKRSKPKSQKVILSLTTGGYKKVLKDFYLKGKNLGASDPQLHITSAKHPLTILIRSQRFEEGAKQDLSADIRPGGFNLESVEEAIEFIENLVTSSGVLEILDENSNPQFIFNEPNQKAPIDFGFSKRLIKGLREVGSKVGVMFKYPNRVNKESWDDLLFLHDVLVQRTAPSLTGQQVFRFVAPLTEKQVRDSFSSPDAITIKLEEKKITLFGHKFTMPEQHAKPISFKIKEIFKRPNVDEVERVVVAIEGMEFIDGE